MIIRHCCATGSGGSVRPTIGTRIDAAITRCYNEFNRLTTCLLASPIHLKVCAGEPADGRKSRKQQLSFIRKMSGRCDPCIYGGCTGRSFAFLARMEEEPNASEERVSDAG